MINVNLTNPLVTCSIFIKTKAVPPATTEGAPACATIDQHETRADRNQAALDSQLTAESLRSVQERLRADSIQRAEAEAAEQERQRPKVLTLVDAASMNIRSHEYSAYAFAIDGAADCRVEARVVGLRGGGRDVEVYLFTDEDFLRWSKHLSFDTPQFGLYRSARLTDVSLSVHLPSVGGKYHLIISNAFSVINGKIVQVQSSVTCTGPAPIPSE